MILNAIKQAIISTVAQRYSIPCACLILSGDRKIVKMIDLVVTWVESKIWSSGLADPLNMVVVLVYIKNPIIMCKGKA